MMAASSSSPSAGGSKGAAAASGKPTLSAAGTASDPVCLLDSDSDSDSDEDDDCRIVSSGSGGGHRAKAEEAQNGSSNTVRGTAYRRKRPAPSSAANHGGGGRRGPLPAEDRFVPFRMYTTSNDLRPARGNNNNSGGNGSGGRAPFTSTLREMIGLDDSNNSLGPLKFLIIFNYLIDFDFLLDEIPELASLDRVLVYYGAAMNPAGPASLHSLMGSRLSTVRLAPSDPPNSTNNPLPFRMDWGVHHTKMFLVGYQYGIRVVIHTSNLRASDFADNAQTAYVQDFPVKTKFCCASGGGGDGGGDGGDGGSGSGGSGADQSSMVREHCDGEDSYALSSPFEEELIRYLESYRQTARYVWPLGGGSHADNHGGGGSGGGAGSTSTPLLLTEVLRRYDYSAAYGVLIPSVPGYHRLRNCPWGHLRLRDVIRAHTRSSATNDDDNDDGDKSTCTSSTGNLLLQFSSLGSISLKWLHELASSMDVAAARAPLQRLPGGAQSSPLLDKIQIIWPTFEEVRTAAAGYAAGGPIPGRVKNTDRPFLRRFYHRWSSSGEDVMRKGRHPGHCKTFLQLGSCSGEDAPTTEVEWCLITSHNLSTAALGQVQNNSRMGEQCLFIRHWELGVFFSPDTLKGAVTVKDERAGTEEPSAATTAKKLKSEGDDNATKVRADDATADKPRVRMVPFRGVDAQYGENDVILPLPFDVKPTRYSSQDVPWATDRHGGRPDAYGRVLG